MSKEIKKDETIQLKNNNLVIDLTIKCSKLIQGLTTLLDLVNEPTTKDIINDSMIMSSESYGKVQEFLLNCISIVNKEIAPKFELFNKEVHKDGTN